MYLIIKKEKKVSQIVVQQTSLGQNSQHSVEEMAQEHLVRKEVTLRIQPGLPKTSPSTLTSFPLGQGHQIGASEKHSNVQVLARHLQVHLMQLQ